MHKYDLGSITGECGGWHRRDVHETMVRQFRRSQLVSDPWLLFAHLRVNKQKKKHDVLVCQLQNSVEVRIHSIIGNFPRVTVYVKLEMWTSNSLHMANIQSRLTLTVHV
jgi:hypothetical protein